MVSTHKKPLIEMQIVKGKAKLKEDWQISLDEFIDVKGWKAIGNKLSQDEVKKVTLLTKPTPLQPSTMGKKVAEPKSGQQDLFGNKEEKLKIVDKRKP